MSDTTDHRNTSPASKAEALAWLAGQFRWETLLADLHELAEREAAPVVDLGPQDASRPSSGEDTNAA
ncbi:MAG TPA: hypothetical protein VGZ52_00525 [Acidimicrobiales bacterium]|jgi:hypothetical protein|nr:hypothetical protein [Acidimicrobiales bacterium]